MSVVHPAAQGIYLVTDSALCGERGVVPTAVAAVGAGIGTVQVRDKHATARELCELVLRVSLAVGQNAAVLVNDRVDVFLAARAEGAAVHGVHIGQDDLAPEQVRRIVGAGPVVGLTVSTTGELARAEALSRGTIDYLGMGVIHPTATKPDASGVIGTAGFGALTELTALPTVAIGGITVRDVAALRAAGASGIAVVSAICGQPAPAAAAAGLVAEWESCGACR